MNLLWLLVVVLLIGSLLGFPGVSFYPHSWGYYPSGLGALAAVVLIIMLLTGRL